MAEGRPPISSSRIATGDIAQHSFAVVRRGFDTDEVRSYLQSVARNLESLEAREEELRAALAEAEERAAHPVVDEATLTTSLGQHSAQILRHAHEEAARIVVQAQEGAATLLRETQSQVDELQESTEASAAERVVEVELLVANAEQEARVESERIVAEAIAAGEAIITRAKDEGRALLDQVQEARRRVLADLAAGDGGSGSRSSSCGRPGTKWPPRSTGCASGSTGSWPTWTGPTRRRGPRRRAWPINSVSARPSSRTTRTRRPRRRGRCRRRGRPRSSRCPRRRAGGGRGRRALGRRALRPYPCRDGGDAEARTGGGAPGPGRHQERRRNGGRGRSAGPGQGGRGRHAMPRRPRTPLRLFRWWSRRRKYWRWSRGPTTPSSPAATSC